MVSGCHEVRTTVVASGMDFSPRMRATDISLGRQPQDFAEKEFRARECGREIVDNMYAVDHGQLVWCLSPASRALMFVCGTDLGLTPISANLRSLESASSIALLALLRFGPIEGSRSVASVVAGSLVVFGAEQN